MTDPAFIIVFVLVFLFSIYLGFAVGSHAGERAVTGREYWLYNLIATVACILATAVLTLVPLLCSAPLGFLAGCLTGLKMGYGESSGPWKLLDRFFNINKGQRARAGRASSAATRRARKTGEAAPDLISVANDAPASSAHGDTTQSAGRGGRKGKRNKR